MGNKLFGTDGIRGIAGEYPLTSSCVYKIGFHAGSVLKQECSESKPVVIIGRDTRKSGEWITRQCAAGLHAAGLTVYDAGIISTPGISYVVQKERFRAGVVVSASHNPVQHNGIKFFSFAGTKLEDAIEERIEQNILDDASNGTEASETAAEPYTKGIDDYINFICGLFRGHSLKGFKIVVDCANGAAYAITPAVLARLGATVIPLFNKPNGKNINDNCGSQHPQHMQKAVREHNAQCGLAHDGDADRVIFTDEKGADIDGDHLLALLSSDFKQKGKLTNDLLVTTVMANLGLVRCMEEKGIKVMQTPVGDRYVYEAMVKENALLGGEQSGHIILRDRVKTGDGIVTALAVLQVMAETGSSLSALSGIMHKYPQVLLNIPVSKKIPVQEISDFQEQVDLHAARYGSNGRIFIRYSGTEALLRIMIEGEDQTDINTTAESLAEIVKTEIGI